MSLEFRKRRFRKPSKSGQLAIAIAAVVVALGIVAAWIAVSFRPQPDPNNTSSDTSQGDVTYENEVARNLLVILTDKGYERFTLVQISPASQRVSVAAVPPTLIGKNGITLVDTMHKNGYADAVRLASETLELPITHYFALTAEQAESWFNYLESGLTVTLPQAVNFTDERGAVVRLDAGEHNLTATQTVALMRYNGWTDIENTHTFTAQIVAAMINRYATPERRFSSDFSSLSNLSRSSLRISDFNDFLPALKHTVSGDDEPLCETEELKGVHRKIGFEFDRKKTAQASTLYRD